MNIGHVSGGTNAGWRRTSPQPTSWSCPTCVRVNARYNANCPNCYTPRPRNGG